VQTYRLARKSPVHRRAPDARRVRIWQLATLALTGAALWALAGVGHGGGLAKSSLREPVLRHELSSVPVAARGPLSAALGRHELGYRVVGLRTHNTPQGFGVTFSTAGVRVSSASTHLSMHLVDYGHAGALRPLAAVAPRASGNRVDYAHRGVDEWYVNGPLGLEQGFDVPTRPAAGSGPLTLSLALSSDARVSLGRSGLVLTSRDVTLRYGGLSATDAHGQDLPSRLVLHHGRLEIRVDDRGAAYPLRIDPFIQAAKLTASNGATADGLGASVAIDGDTIVAGAIGKTIGQNAGQGALYVFVRPASGWANATQTAELTVSDGAAQDGLGSVAISGDTIVAGVSARTVGTHVDQGVVYVFVKPAGGWKDGHETAKLTASDGTTGGSLGSTVSISGDTILASAPGASPNGTSDQGAGYVFVKPAGGWKDGTQTAELTASDGAAQDSLGLVNGASISGDTVVLGSSFHEVGNNPGQGAAYVYVKPASGWTNMTETAELTASDGAAGDRFGLAVAISGDTVAVGAFHHLVGGARSGSAYVFVKPAPGWLLDAPTATQTAELTPSDGATNDRFGAQLGVWGNTVVVGSFLHQVGANQAQGAAYVFSRPGLTWKSETETRQVAAADGARSDFFADSVAVSGNLVVAGAPLHMVGRNQSQGAIYLFGPPPSVTIRTPANGATLAQGRAIHASYSCLAPAGARITSCTGPVAVGASINTFKRGRHSFTVTASDTDGLRATQTVTYTVIRTGGAPVITAFKQTAQRWREGGKLAHISRRRPAPVGTTFSFSLDRAAAAQLRFTRLTTGHKQRRIAAGALRLQAHAGLNRVHFQGRLSRTRKLPLGTYAIKLTASSAGGRSTTTRALTFTIVK
jgi:hypothetical protein